MSEAASTSPNSPAGSAKSASSGSASAKSASAKSAGAGSASAKSASAGSASAQSAKASSASAKSANTTQGTQATEGTQAAQSSSSWSLVNLHGRSPWSVLPPLILGFFMIMVDTTIVNIAVPTLVRELDASIVAVGWVNSAYLLSYATLLLLSGRLGDRFGSRGVFLTGLVVFTLASAWCGLSGDIGWLIVARAVQGVGAALMTPQTMAIITRVFPADKRGAAMGLWGATAGVATIAGPLLGGVFVEYTGWEWIFFVNIPIGIVALVLALRFLPRLETHTANFDVLGVVLSIIGLGLFVFGIQEGSTYDWGTITGPISVWGVIGAGLVVLGIFVWWQSRRGSEALLPLRLFRNRTFALSNVSGMAVSFAMVGVFFPLTLFLQSILGLSAIEAALINLPSSLISGVVAPFAGRWSDRISGKWVVAAGFFFLALGIGLSAAMITPDLMAWHLIFPMLLFGVGTGLVFSPLANLATAGLDSRTAGAGAGAFNTTRQMGGVLGSAAIVAALTSRLGVEIPKAGEAVAGDIPDAYREQFLQGLRASASEFSMESAGGAASGFELPAGVPDSVKEQLGSVITGVIHGGFANATAQTLLVAVAVLVLGLLASLAIPAHPERGRKSD